jgi:transcriptional regulator with XRE-family HTH domain
MTAPKPPGRQPVDVDLNARLGAVIRQRRTMLGLSQRDIGKRLGVSFQQTHKYESGKNQLTFVRLVEVARILGIRVGDLAEAALTNEAPAAEVSDRETLEFMKRLATLTPNQRRGVQLLVNSLAGEVA